MTDTSKNQPIATLEDALAVVANLRDENKGLRKRAQEAETRTPELEAQVAALQEAAEDHTVSTAARDAELSAERFGRTRDRLAHQHGIPVEIAETISADNEETLTERLEALAAFRGKPEETQAARLRPDPAQAAEPALDADAQRLADADAFFNSKRS